ncbi:hypothetical protein AB4589_07725 [Vibrio sp. 10N.222.49.A3]|uniref:hypothetical protein n=1 Tax=Vibrio sp. 10N.222.49.A3 TaxID=3229611 RepID=UPI00354FAF8C
MSKRERGFQRTKQELKDALSRLIANQPESIELKQRLQSGKVIKINNANVEKEAGKANQALRRHPDVKEEIEKAESERLFGKPRTNSIYSIKNEPLFKQQKQRLDNARAIKKKLEAEKSELQEEARRKDEVLKLQASKMDEMIAALWDAIPPEDIENRMAAAKKIIEVVWFRGVDPSTG